MSSEKNRNESKIKNIKLTADLMNEKEFQIDDNNITFENIMNVVAGRISSKKLLKALPHLEEAEYLDEDSEDLNNMNELNFSQVNRDNREDWIFIFLAGSIWRAFPSKNEGQRTSNFEKSS